MVSLQKPSMLFSVGPSQNLLNRKECIKEFHVSISRDYNPVLEC